MPAADSGDSEPPGVDTLVLHHREQLGALVRRVEALERDRAEGNDAVSEKDAKIPWWKPRSDTQNATDTTHAGGRKAAG